MGRPAPVGGAATDCLIGGTSLAANDMLPEFAGEVTPWRRCVLSTSLLSLSGEEGRDLAALPSLAFFTGLTPVLWLAGLPHSLELPSLEGGAAGLAHAFPALSFCMAAALLPAPGLSGAAAGACRLGWLAAAAAACLKGDARFLILGTAL